jgi:hypothetical protein
MIIFVQPLSRFINQLFKIRVLLNTIIVFLYAFCTLNNKCLTTLTIYTLHCIVLYVCMYVEIVYFLPVSIVQHYTEL